MTRTSFTVSDTFARELSSRGDEVLKAVAQSAECKVYLRGDGGVQLQDLMEVMDSHWLLLLLYMIRL